MVKQRTQNYLYRILGFEAHAEVADAMASIHRGRSQGVPLVLIGHEDMVPMALALHRVELGEGAPFVLSDRRRKKGESDVRSVANCADPFEALEMARGGTLCIRAQRLPRKQVASLVRLARAAGVLLMISSDPRKGVWDEFLSLLSPIRLPPMAARKEEVERVVHEYAADAAAALGTSMDFYFDDLAWVIGNSAKSLHDIEKGTLRLAALRESGSVLGAAARLGMAAVSLRRWLGRRGAAPGKARDLAREAKPARRVRIKVTKAELAEPAAS